MKDVVVQRGGLIESAHRVHAAVVNEKGEIIAKVGDPHRVVFCRSAAKPFQAVPLVEEHILDEFGINPNELAVICASHSGEPKHIEAVRSILDKIGLCEKDLECGPHPPFRESAAIELYTNRKEIGPIYNNCSGKHAGMLAMALSKDWDTEGYINRDHPVQVRMLSEISRWTSLRESEIKLGVDGCGVVCFGLPLQSLAKAFCALGNDDSPNHRIVSAMTNYPDMVAGTGRFGTALIERLGDRIFAKTGAEGVFAVGSTEGDFGMVVKIEDGAKRATPIIVLQILDHLKLLGDEDKEKLEMFSSPVIRNTLGQIVGEISSNIELVAE